MAEQTAKRYDLEDRTLEFLKATIPLCKKLPKSEINRRLIGQVVRSAGSVGANYREANESISPKDLKLRIKISRKEAKEAISGSRLYSRRILNSKMKPRH